MNRLDGMDEEDGYEDVEGLDQETVALKREYEAEVEAKVASDYAHIVLAYGVIWTLFAAYGMYLLFRSGRLSRDLGELRRKVGGKK